MSGDKFPTAVHQFLFLAAGFHLLLLQGGLNVLRLGFLQKDKDGFLWSQRADRGHVEVAYRLISDNLWQTRVALLKWASLSNYS